MVKRLLHVWLNGKMMPELQNYAEARKKFLKDYGLKTVKQEFRVKSLRYWYAGTPDESCQGMAGRVLVDYKTGQWTPRYDAQLNLYDMAFSEKGGHSHDRLYVVTLNEDGTYKPKPVVKDWALGIRCVKTFEEANYRVN